VSPSGARRPSIRLASSRLVWVILAVLLGVGLAIGSGLGSGNGKPTRAQRIAHLDAIIGCPSCADLSVGESSASSAVAIRNLVAAQVDAGASDRVVERSVEAGYGASILLVPPRSGLGSLVWILPLVAVLLGSLGLILVLSRRRRGPREASSQADRALVEEALGQ
jgi:cytochrome c-type biogenesis protein CcmH